MIIQVLSVAAILLLVVPSVSAADGDNQMVMQLDRSPGLSFNIAPNVSISLKDVGLGFIGPGGQIYGAGFANSDWAVSKVSTNQVTYKTDLDMKVLNKTLLENLSQYLPVNLSNISSLENLLPGLSNIVGSNTVKPMADSIEVIVYINVTRISAASNNNVSIYQNNSSVINYTNGNFSLIELNYSFQFPEFSPPGFLFMIQYVHGISDYQYAHFGKVSVKATYERALRDGIRLDFGSHSNYSAYYWWNNSYLNNGGSTGYYNFSYNVGFGKQSVVFFYNLTSQTQSVNEDPVFMVPAVSITTISLPPAIGHAVSYLARHLFFIGIGMAAAGVFLLGGYGVYRKRKIL